MHTPSSNGPHSGHHLLHKGDADKSQDIMVLGQISLNDGSAGKAKSTFEAQLPTAVFIHLAEDLLSEVHNLVPAGAILTGHSFTRYPRNLRGIRHALDTKVIATASFFETIVVAFVEAVRDTYVVDTYAHNELSQLLEDLPGRFVYFQEQLETAVEQAKFLGRDRQILEYNAAQLNSWGDDWRVQLSPLQWNEIEKLEEQQKKEQEEQQDEQEEQDEQDEQEEQEKQEKQEKDMQLDKRRAKSVRRQTRRDH